VCVSNLQPPQNQTNQPPQQTETTTTTITTTSNKNPKTNTNTTNTSNKNQHQYQQASAMDPALLAVNHFCRAVGAFCFALVCAFVRFLGHYFILVVGYCCCRRW
jgi:hypothetical protein